jgi:hypothetical protein
MSRRLFAVCLVVCLSGWLSSAARADSPSRAKLVDVTYQVADLVIPIDRSPVLVSVGEETRAERPCPGKAISTEDNLIWLITHTVAPGGWSEKGGPGTINYFPLTMSLVVKQTPEIQTQVAQLLSSLRREQDVEASAEIIFVRLPESFCKRSKITCLRGAPRMLTTEELSAFLEKTQSEQLANIMQAPKLTMMSGQQAAFRLNEEGREIEVRLNPTVSADRRFVRTELSLRWKHDTSAGEESANVVLPDGGAVMLAGWIEMREVRRESGLPLLQPLPYINRLFKTSGVFHEPFRTLVLVRPRIIVAEETEQKAAAQASRKQAPAARGSCAESEQAADKANQVEKLLEKYQRACSVGDLVRARKLARKALELDPTCFAPEQ